MFYPLYILASFVIYLLTVGVWVYFWASYVTPMICKSLFVLVPYCFDYWSFRVLCEVRECDWPCCFSFSELVWLFRVFCVPIQTLRLSFVLNVQKKIHWWFDRNRVESVDYLGSYSHFDNIDSSNPITWYVFPSVCVSYNFFQ